MPFGRNPFFTGREPLLLLLHEQLHNTQHIALNQSQALTGLGGIGKTQTAVEYAFRYRQEYTAVFWVRAASRETLIADYVALARLLALPGQDAQEQILIVEEVKRWLGQHAGWLLILDNADELPLVKDFLPTKSEGHVLLTTRAQATGKIAKSLAIERLEPSESMQLLLRRAKLLASDEPLDNVSRAVRTSAQALVEELDGLPLALDQVGAYIEETGCSLAEYLALYRSRRLALLKRQSSISADYPHSVASTWSLSFQQVEQANPAAAELLRLCAFLYPDAIPEEIITEGAAEWGPVLEKVTDDSLLLNEAVQVLRRYSLLKRDSEARLLVIHRLVQVVLKDGMDQETQRQWAERTVRAVSQAFPEVSFDTWSRCDRCLPHAQACARLIDEYHFTFQETARLLDQAGYYLLERGLYEQAELLLQHALTLCKEVLDPEHPDAATTLDHLAQLYVAHGKFEEAEPLHLRALAIREQQLGSNDPKTAITVNNLAWLYHYQGKYEQAEPLYQRALAIREKALGFNHPNVVQSLNNLALLYQAQGKYEPVEPLYQRALVICEQRLGPNHFETAITLNNLALLYWCQGRYEEAEPIHQRALAARERKLGSTHHDVAQSLNNLALLYQAQGYFEEAEPLYRRALAIREQALGPEHPRTAATLDSLGTLYTVQGKHAQAEPLCLRAMTVREQKLGPNHPDVAQSLHHLADLYYAWGKYAQAEPLYQRALAIREEKLGPEHPDTIKVRADYAGLLHRMEGKVVDGLSQQEVR